MTTRVQPFKPDACNWLVETNGNWAVCGLPVVGYSVYGDKAPLCRTHLNTEGKHVLAKGKA